MDKIQHHLIFLFLLLSASTEACRGIAEIQRLFTFKTPTAPPSELFKLKTAALKKISHPSKRETFNCAFNQFKDTPGFLATVNAFVQHTNEDSAEGHWYEIEKALALHERHCTDKKCPVILAFNQKISASDNTREFDIIAYLKNGPHFYECKNINWNGGKRKKRLQFLAQKRIVEDLKKRHNIACSYLLCSKQELPAKWACWFKENEITVEQEKNSLS